MTKPIQGTDVTVRVKLSVQISVAIMMFAALVLVRGFYSTFFVERYS